MGFYNHSVRTPSQLVKLAAGTHLDNCLWIEITDASPNNSNENLNVGSPLINFNNCSNFIAISCHICLFIAI